MGQYERDSRRRKRLLKHLRTKRIDINQEQFSGSRSTFYLCSRAYPAQGDAGLIKKEPNPRPMPIQTLPEVVEKLLHVLDIFHLDPIRVVYQWSATTRFLGPMLGCTGFLSVMESTGCRATRARWFSIRLLGRIPFDRPMKCRATTQSPPQSCSYFS